MNNNSIENSNEGNQHEKKEDTPTIFLEFIFNIAENILAVEGREKAKVHLGAIYDELIRLNKRDKEDWKNTSVWNKEGDLTEEKFNKLNLRRKLLSNAIGIMTASGEIRHNLNKI